MSKYFYQQLKVIDFDDYLYLASLESEFPLEKYTNPSVETQPLVQHEGSQLPDVSSRVSNVIIFSLLIGIAISVLIVLVCKALLKNTSSITEVYDDTEVGNSEDGKEYIDVEFTEKTHEDFDYPYEDMDEVLGER